VDLATNICNRIFKKTNNRIELGKIDATFFRDDIGTHEGILFPNENSIPFEITGKPVLLIDDVIFTGRTIRAAMEALLSMGRPEWIKLMVLVNRHLDREIPISVDYEGFKADLDPSQKIKISFDKSGSEAKIIKE
jgi:pyrimidine operon attenuation protein/uracil phosphoribosyltransferase